MNEIQSRMEALKKIHAEMSAMADPEPEQIEALGEDVASLLRDAAAWLFELTPPNEATEAALRAIAEMTEALTTLDGDA